MSAYLAAREQSESGNTSAGDSGLAVDGLVSAAGRALATLAQLNHEESQTFQRAAEWENTRANVIGGPWWGLSCWSEQAFSIC